MSADDHFVTYKEAAAMIGVSERSIQRLVARQELAAVSITGEDGRCMRITKESVVLHLERVLAKARREWRYDLIALHGAK